MVNIKDIVIMAVALFLSLFVTNFVLGFVPSFGAIADTAIQFGVTSAILLFVWNRLKRLAP